MGVLVGLGTAEALFLLIRKKKKKREKERRGRTEEKGRKVAISNPKEKDERPRTPTTYR
jgi:hypothetical protein